MTEGNEVGAPMDDNAAELSTGWPKWIFRAQALVLGMAVGQILAAHGV